MVSQRKIANSLNINQSTVSRSIKKIGLKYKNVVEHPRQLELKRKGSQRDLKKLLTNFFTN